MITCLFETASAVGTVGLSLGITPELNLLSRVVLILLMFLEALLSPALSYWSGRQRFEYRYRDSGPV